VRRDGRPLDEALPLLCAVEPNITRLVRGITPSELVSEMASSLGAPP
jgi:hypothetical protein